MVILIPPKASWLRRAIFRLKMRIGWPIPAVEREYDSIQAAVNALTKAGGVVKIVPVSEDKT